MRYMNVSSYSTVLTEQDYYIYRNFGMYGSVAAEGAATDN